MNVLKLAEWVRTGGASDRRNLEKMAAECECTPAEALAATYAGDNAGLGRAFIDLYVNGSDAVTAGKAAKARRNLHRQVTKKSREFARLLEQKRNDMNMTKTEFAQAIGVGSGYWTMSQGRWIPTESHPAHSRILSMGINPNDYR